MPLAALDGVIETVARSLDVSLGAARVLTWGALAGVLLFVAPGIAWRVRRALTRRARAGAPRSARKAARDAVDTGNFTFAARHLAAAGDPEGARRIHEDAFRIANERGETGRAARHLAALGRQREAGRLLLRSGDWRGAAEMFEAAGDLADAARALETGGRLLEAADRFVRGGRLEEALRTLTRATSSAAPPELRSRRQDIARNAARIALRLGRHAAAADLHEIAGETAEAARAHELAGKRDRAGELYEKLGENSRAAACFDACGESRRADRCRGLEAAAAGDHDRAADLLGSSGDLLGAAQSLSAGGRPLEAARLQERVGNISEAGWLYRRAGDLENAVRCFERAGDWHEAARAHEDLGNDERAATSYLRVPDDDDRSVEARGLAGLAWLRLGRTKEARPLLEQAVATAEAMGSAAPSASDWLRGLAACCQADGDRPGALARYRAALALDPDDSELQEIVLKLDPSAAAAATKTGSLAPPRYEVLRELGAGGMGRVYLARDSRLERMVALKVLSERWQERPELRERFVREARVAARLTHPNVVSVYDVGEHEGRPYMALEYVPGRDLASLMGEKRRLTVEEALPLLRGIALALEAAHECGIVHRDIKPDNVMLREDGVVKVGDFGIARVDDGNKTRAGVVMGTPRFMAPEQVTNRPVDARTDLYALGGTAFVMLTGRPVFIEGDLPYQHAHARPPDPREFAPGLPPALAELILACLAKRPANRPKSARAFLDQLEACIRTATTTV